MFKLLIAQASAAAQAVLQAPGLPSQAQALRKDAGGFAAQIEPALATATTHITSVAGKAMAAVVALQPDLMAWKGGSSESMVRLAARLKGLLEQFDDLIAQDRLSFQTLVHYRDQIIADQKAIASIISELNARIAALRSELLQRESQLKSQQQRMLFLRMISPIGWAIAEIANLCQSNRSIEQEVAEDHGKLSVLQGQLSQTGQASSAAQGFSSQLEILENALQNLLNSVLTTQGHLAQIVGSLQSSSQNCSPAVVEAYLATLSAQSDQLISYMTGGAMAIDG
jgi:hypothetical protein